MQATDAYVPGSFGQSPLLHQARAQGKFLIPAKVNPDLPRARLSYPCLLDRHCYISLNAASKDACITSDCLFFQVALGDAGSLVICWLVSTWPVASSCLWARLLWLNCPPCDRWSSFTFVGQHSSKQVARSRSRCKCSFACSIRIRVQSSV